ncbi:MAG: T9SS C-terminal target domain-containing protein [Chitinophagia bacterium]|nr:T9SS C-terminal target domain-containing protein [Chitinophagia bacterium]
MLLDESSSSYGSTIANVVRDSMNFRNNIIAGTSNNSTPYPKDIVYVINGARSLTPTTVSDTTSFIAAVGMNTVPWLTSSTNRNKVYGTTSAIALGNPFYLLNPVLVPNSGSDIVYGSVRFPSWSAADIFNPDMPLSNDTTSPATYNMPNFPPNFTTNRSNDPWFVRTNYVGAFGRTSAGNDNWMAGWCSFDPLNEPYDTICYTAPIVAVNNVATIYENPVTVFPNPAKDLVSVSLEIQMGGYTKITVIDIAGNLVKTVFEGNTITGKQSFDFNTSGMPNGNYLVSVMSDGKHKLMRFAVHK